MYSLLTDLPPGPTLGRSVLLFGCTLGVAWVGPGGMGRGGEVSGDPSGNGWNHFQVHYVLWVHMYIRHQ
jgi:hypothetical protein